MIFTFKIFRIFAYSLASYISEITPDGFSDTIKSTGLVFQNQDLSIENNK